MQRIDRRLAEAEKPSAAQLYTESLLSHPSDRSVPVDRVPSYTAPTSSNTSSVKVRKILPDQFSLNLIIEPVSKMTNIIELSQYQCYKCFITVEK